METDSFAMAVKVSKVIVLQQHPDELIELEMAKNIVKELEKLVDAEPDEGAGIHFTFVKAFNGYILAGYADDNSLKWLEEKIMEIETALDIGLRLTADEVSPFTTVKLRVDDPNLTPAYLLQRLLKQDKNRDVRA